ncbi:uncharacterized protein MONOS_17494 [Monocercomonoides exilis]|uniref:uncharacterized protein n=1 Tax=Monocercomonoides exilis TaxID=2049356 RepID=UPI003559439B|nr:hypothetical protein MONOS_17494 [Monocercomonoides exilis]
MALLAIRNVLFEECMQKFQLDKHLKLIIKNHQQCNNLTHYAYQLAWNCFLKRLRDKRKIEAEIANDLHFVEEMTRELGELLQCVDWREKDMKLYEMKEVSIILNWINSYESLFDWKLPEEEVTVGLVERFFELYREAKDNHRKIAIACVEILQKMIDKETVNIGVMMRLRIEDIIIGEIRQHILDDMHTVNCAKMNLTVSERLKVNFKKKNANTFLKMLYTKYIEKLEEEGYEDAIISLQGMLHQKKFRNLSKNPCDYFV